MKDYTELTLVATRGLSGSGKSTWAKAEAARSGDRVRRVNRDSLRLMFGDQFNVKHEKDILLLRNACIEALLHHNKSVICDDTNLGRMDDLEAMAKGNGARFVVRTFMDVSVEECIKRDLQRQYSVGKDVIEGQYYRYWNNQTIPENSGENPCVICDLDGTLALLPPGMGYPAAYNRDYRGDVVNFAVRVALPTGAGYAKLILMSGRDEGVARQQTEEWLDAHQIEYDALIMRPAGDKRPDYVVKKELYMKHIQGRLHVNRVYDDRPSVCRMWRAELGLPVLCVSNGIEF